MVSVVLRVYRNAARISLTAPPQAPRMSTKHFNPIRRRNTGIRFFSSRDITIDTIHTELQCNSVNNIIFEIKKTSVVKNVCCSKRPQPPKDQPPNTPSMRCLASCVRNKTWVTRTSRTGVLNNYSHIPSIGYIDH